MILLDAILEVFPEAGAETEDARKQPTWGRTPSSVQSSKARQPRPKQGSHNGTPT